MVDSKLIALAALVLGAGLVGPAPAQEHTYVPPEGYVPDAATARAVAIAVLTPVYGRAVVDKELPFEARLEKGVWTVEGSPPAGRDPGQFIGGLALVRISRKTGAILRMTHGR